MKIEHTAIKVEKITRNVFVASCNLLKPIKTQVNMSGATEENAKKKLDLFLNNEPYNHIP